MDHLAEESELRNFICSGCLEREGRRVLAGAKHIVVRCSRCHLASMLPKPGPLAGSNEQLDDLQEYERLMHRLQPGFKHHAAKLLELLNRYSPPPGRLLEIGCASGLFLTEARNAGYTVTGLEPAAGHREVIPAAIAGSILPMTLEEADFPEHSFDVIVAIQLLEHLVAPAVFAEKLKRVLKPGGIAYVETPNFDCLSRYLRLRTWMETNVGYGAHWHLFNPGSIQTFCSRMGMTSVRCWTFFKALGLHSRSPLLGKSMSMALDQTLGRAGLGNNVAVLIRRS